MLAGDGIPLAVLWPVDGDPIDRVGDASPVRGALVGPTCLWAIRGVMPADGVVQGERGMDSE